MSKKAKPKIPYADTRISPEKTKAEISEMLKSQGIENIQWTAFRGDEVLRFLKEVDLKGEEATTALAGVLKLATIEGVDTASAANMVVQAMTMYGLSAEEATRVVDDFVKASAAGIDTASGYASGLSNVGATAANMGLSLEETMAALVQLDNTFGGAVESGTFLNRMLLDMVAKADQAGISLYNADGSMKGLDDIVGQIREKIQGFGDDQQAMNEWLGQFDSRAQKAITALVNYDGSVVETQAKLGEMAGAQDQVNVILGTYEGQMAKVQAQQENAAIQTGEITTKMSLLGAQFTAALGPVGLFANALGPPMLQGVMQGLTVAAIPKLIGALGSGGLTGALGSVGGGISSIAGMIGAAGPLGIALVGIGAAVGVFALAWSQNWFGIRDKAKAAIDAIGGAFKGLQNWLGDLGKSWSNFWKGAAKDAEKSADKISDSTEKIELGESPGGLRDLIDTTKNLGETWNRTISGLRPMKDLGLGDQYPVTASGFEPTRAPVTLVFNEGAIQFIQPRLDSSTDRRALVRELAEDIGKELMMRR